MASGQSPADHQRGVSSSRESVHSTADLSDSQSINEHGWSSGLTSGLRRRVSVPHRLGLTDIGGVNSIRSFTRSWQRAAGFAEVLPQRPPIVFAPDQAPLLQPPYSSSPPIPIRSDIESSPEQWTSLLRQHSHERPGSSHPDQGLDAQRPSGDFRERERKAFNAELEGAFYGSSPSDSSRRHSIFAVPPSLASPLVGSYSSYRSYGAIDHEPERRVSISDAWRREAEERAEEEELEPILVKEVEQDGKIVLAVEGQSTLPQTVFNSINVLVGVGLLSLPLGLRYAGWVCGMLALFLCALVTAYTAKLLGRCIDLDPSLVTFSDIAYISYGRRARIATSVLFTLELVAANVALVVLFSDSMELLYPGFFTAVQWKMLCTIILLPLNFMPLRLLSFTSVIGIFSCFGIVSIVVMDGLIKPTAPGSLLEPAATYMFPERWSTLPLSFGLLLSPWGGHSVFPNIYRDMRHPYRYKEALKITYIFTYLLDAVTAAAGILMFGDEVRDAISSNILRTSGYPRALTVLMCVFIAVIPLTKIPLNGRPIVNTVELLLGVHHPHHSSHGHGLHHAGGEDGHDAGSGATYRLVARVSARVLTLATFLVIAIVFPSFDSIMAFMGSALCFTICIILPLAFYLRLFNHQISPQERLLAYFLIVVSSILSILGTIWAFLPKSLIGAD